MSYYPAWDPDPITATTYCTAGWANAVQDNLKAMLQDVYNTKGNASTLVAFTRVTMNASGAVTTNAIAHTRLALIGPNQHHNRDHAETHTDSTDDIPEASSGRSGLVPASAAEKLADIASKATRNWVSDGEYTGTSVASQLVSVGYRPEYVMVMRGRAYWPNNVGWQTIDGATYAIQHIAASHTQADLDHKRIVATTVIEIVTSGFKAKASANVSGQPYLYFSMRSQ